MIDPVELKALVDWLAKTSAGHAAKASDFMMLDDSGSAAFHDQQAEKVSKAAIAILALSDEVERLKEEAEEASVWPDWARKILLLLKRYGYHEPDDGVDLPQDLADWLEGYRDAAESEAQALRERMGEIQTELSELNITNEELTRLRNDMEGKEWVQVWARACQKIIDCVRDCRRIAALSTMPKEKEGC